MTLSSPAHGAWNPVPDQGPVRGSSDDILARMPVALFALASLPDGRMEDARVDFAAVVDLFEPVENEREERGEQEERRDAHRGIRDAESRFGIEVEEKERRREEARGEDRPEYDEGGPGFQGSVRKWLGRHYTAVSRRSTRIVTRPSRRVPRLFPRGASRLPSPEGRTSPRARRAPGISFARALCPRASSRTA